MSEALETSAPPWADLVSAAQATDQRIDQLTELVTSLAETVAVAATSNHEGIDLQDVADAGFDSQSESNTYVDTDSAKRTVQAESEVERLQVELATAFAENESLVSERDTMMQQCEQWEKDCAELRDQNEDLAASVASGQVRKQLNEQHSETLSWEQRKELIFQQMEDDTFDAEAFVGEIGKELVSDSDQADAQSSPLQFVQSLLERVDRAEEERDRQREEISQLQRSLEERAPVIAGNDGQPMAMGAAALVGLIDDNELVQEERERLKELQSEWEGKFRQMEVESSLARAKLSRERQELSNKLTEVETELEQAQRAGRVEEETGGASRKWLAKLGIE